MLSTLIFVFIFCVVAVLVYMGRYSGRVRLEQTRLIDAPLTAVYAMVADLHQWQKWNPWLTPDSGTTTTFTDSADGRSSRCAWDSATMGAGTIEQVGLQTLERIEQRVRLRHPFTVSGRSYWTFDDQDGKTQVTWGLRGRVAFSMRAFAATVKGSLALDCRHALDQLASLLEPANAARYEIIHLGVRDVPAIRYVYRHYQGSINGLPEAVADVTAELRQQLAAAGVPVAGAPLAIYYKTNIKLRTTSCHIGIPVDTKDDFETFPVRELAAHRAYVVRLKGHRAALEIAWFYAMQRMVAEKIQPDQRLPPFERYLVDDDSATGNEALAELYLPVRPVAAI